MWYANTLIFSFSLFGHSKKIKTRLKTNPSVNWNQKKCSQILSSGLFTEMPHNRSHWSVWKIKYIKQAQRQSNESGKRERGKKNTTKSNEKPWDEEALSPILRDWEDGNISELILKSMYFKCENAFAIKKFRSLRIDCICSHE